MPKNVDLSKSINREKVIEPSIANNEKNIGCPPLLMQLSVYARVSDPDPYPDPDPHGSALI